MKKITEIDSLNQIIAKYGIKGTITNNYLLPAAYHSYIANGTLYSLEVKSNVCILNDKGEYYQLYFYINARDEYFQISMDKPVTMEILYRGEDQKPNDIISYWESCGFRQHIVRESMLASLKQLIIQEDKTSNIEIKFAESNQEALYAFNLFVETFDKFTGDILSLSAINEFVENKNILCAFWNGNLCGALQFEIKNNVVWIGHIAVSPEYRGKGIARGLVNTYIKKNAIQLNTSYQLWVMQENQSAIALYKKIGFIYANKSSASMLKI